jgi:hypothetical protein
VAITDQEGLTPDTSAALTGMGVEPSAGNRYATEADLAAAIAAIPGGGGGTGEGVVILHGSASTTWVLTHSLPFQPNVTIVDSAGNVVIGSAHYDSDTQITVTFSAPFSGKAILS